LVSGCPVASAFFPSTPQSPGHWVPVFQAKGWSGAVTEVGPSGARYVPGLRRENYQIRQFAQHHIVEPPTRISVCRSWLLNIIIKGKENQVTAGFKPT
jgi:hypothetical protein